MSMYDCTVAGCGPNFELHLSWLPREGDEFIVPELGPIRVCFSRVHLAARGYMTDMSNLRVDLDCEPVKL